MKYAEEKKESLRTYFENEAKLGKRFALTLDEYTSLQNVKYIKINVHDENTHWSLGMEKLRGSINSARLTEIVSKKLTEFNLELNKHIVGCTTDGASVMVKFGKEIAPFHQQCIAHTIHLSVCDVLYTNRNDIEQTEIPAQNEETSDENEDVDHENNVLGFESQEDVTKQFSEDYRDMLEKVRRICKIFRKSPLKNGQLQDFVRGEFGKELMLTLDCKTRWNSILPMIDRFIKLKNCIPKALRVVGSTEVISESDWHTLCVLSDTLNPVEIVLKKLCSDGMNILKAEASITFLLSKMKSMQNCFAAQLHQSLLQRYSQRRQIEAISLSKYLHNLSYLHNDTMFSINSKAMIKKCAQQTVTRLFEDAQTSSSETEVIENTQQQSGETEEKDFYEEYAKTLEKFDSDAQSLPCKPGMNKELKYFEETGSRCSNIQIIHAL